jgi:hypothetical protein
LRRRLRPGFATTSALIGFGCGVLTSASAVTNDLAFTSITKQGDCVILEWRSHPRKYYTVYWTDRLELPIFWRAAEVNVPSGGTNTVWSEGECSQSMMAGTGSGGGGFAQPSALDTAADDGKDYEYDVPDYLYPPGHPKAPKTTSKPATKTTPPASGGGAGGPMALLSASPTPPVWPCKFCGELGVGVLLRDLNLVRKPFVTHLNMRTPTDCFAYVDKLCYFGTNYSPGKIYVSANPNGYGNSTYYFDDIRAEDFAGHIFGYRAALGVFANGASSNSVVYTNAFERTGVSQCTNVAGYLCWGYHGGLATYYPTNGQVNFHGQSSWYLVMSIESYNGQWEPFDFQTSYRFWFVDNAFFGEGYEFTAVGAVSHLYEPSTGGVNDSYDYFGLWERGKSLAICAWGSRGTHAFQTIGDPFVIK